MVKLAPYELVVGFTTGIASGLIKCHEVGVRARELIGTKRIA
jgi:hypothetical protein